MQIDDVVGSVPVHGFCGIWGVIAAALFATPKYYGAAYYADRAKDCAGILYGGDGGALAANLLFVLFLIAWVGSLTAAVVVPLNACGMLRVTLNVELEGMDDSKHGGKQHEMVAILPDKKVGV